jgi:four helix bundle protein
MKWKSGEGLMTSHKTGGNAMKTHKDLEVWKNSMTLVQEVYKFTTDYPQNEIYGLTNQMRRAAVSIPSNIAEGAARTSSKEFTRFLSVSQGSLAELETQTILSERLGFLAGTDSTKMLGDMNLIRAQLTGLIRYIKRK